ncbi:DedA family protein [Kushneria indalinina]|uniref:Membrane protein DedA with SNARE-associated domain n=1 Tax=Kushneria indalinina DSM 14324 TaxID=1122140 RepID=A0A3D9DUV4_9GAMM|nr:DedA family protein [Kushneria indalinina]REC94580.1 membrane protein DedA with SNARE-associated domain [Kushneria indalinina DSM 14324]
MQAWLQQLLDTHGYTAITLLTVIINAFPPLPAESTLPVLAHMMSSANMALAPAVLAATLGLVLGTLPLYLLGRWLDERQCMRFLARHGHWLALTPSDIERSGRQFGRYGYLVVLFGRLVPGMRSLVSIPAGFHRMPLLPYLLYTTLGSSLWACCLVGGSHWLLQHTALSGSLWVVMAVLLAVALLYVVRLWRHHRHADR